MSEGPDAPDVLALLRQLQQTYAEELGDKVDDIDQALLSLESDVSYKDRYATTYRLVHSLKGGAGTYGLTIVSEICHLLEEHLNLLVDPRQPNRNWLLGQCFKHVDLMRQVQLLAVSGSQAFEAATAELALLRQALTGKRKHVLVVEISRVSLRLVQQALDRNGAATTVVESGLEALELLMKRPFDVLVTAMENRMLNGVALIAAVRLAGGLNRDIRAVLLSSTVQPVAMNRETAADAVVLRDAHFTHRLNRELDRLCN